MSITVELLVTGLSLLFFLPVSRFFFFLRALTFFTVAALMYDVQLFAQRISLLKMIMGSQIHMSFLKSAENSIVQKLFQEHFSQSFMRHLSCSFLLHIIVLSSCFAIHLLTIVACDLLQESKGVRTCARRSLG